MTAINTVAKCEQKIDVINDDDRKHRTFRRKCKTQEIIFWLHFKCPFPRSVLSRSFRIHAIALSMSKSSDV